jgi:hypothetical protein
MMSARPALILVFVFICILLFFKLRLNSSFSPGAIRKSNLHASRPAGERLAVSG